MFSVTVIYFILSKKKNADGSKLHKFITTILFFIPLYHFHIMILCQNAICVTLHLKMNSETETRILRAEPNIYHVQKETCVRDVMVNLTLMIMAIHVVNAVRTGCIKIIRVQTNYILLFFCPFIRNNYHFIVMVANIDWRITCSEECGYQEYHEPGSYQFSHAVDAWNEKGCPKCGKP